jgi:hypothetical protein
MSGGWWIAVIGGALLLVPLALDVRWGTEARLARWWVSWARHQGSPALWSFLLSLGALAAYSACALVGAALGKAAGDPLWALVPALPAMVAYAPFVFATMPVQYGGYRAWRQELARAGAEPALQRRIAWPAGIPSFLGMMAVIVTLFPIFLP